MIWVFVLLLMISIKAPAWLYLAWMLFILLGGDNGH